MKIDSVVCTANRIAFFRGKEYARAYQKFSQASYKRLSKALFHDADEFRFNFAPLLNTPGWMAMLRDDLREVEVKDVETI